MTAATATSTRRVSLVDVVVLTATSIVPLLLGADGRLNADTKQYLYLDPGGLLRRALTLWDPAVAGGTVSHQQLGYLWPMGPFYWVMDASAFPIGPRSDCGSASSSCLRDSARSCCSAHCCHTIARSWSARSPTG